jgi:hypothetical protein
LRLGIERPPVDLLQLALRACCGDQPGATYSSFSGWCRVQNALYFGATTQHSSPFARLAAHRFWYFWPLAVVTVGVRICRKEPTPDEMPENAPGDLGGHDLAAVSEPVVLQ